MAVESSKELTLWNCNVKYVLDSNRTHFPDLPHADRLSVHFNLRKVHVVGDSFTMTDFGHDCFSHFTYNGLANIEEGKVTLWNGDRSVAHVIMENDGEWMDDKGAIFQTHPCEIKKFRNPWKLNTPDEREE